MADIVQIRRDTATNWTNANPTLANGEQGYETDTKKMKVGDGSTTWTSLAYFAGGTGSSTWAGLTDTPGSITSLQLVRGNSAGDKLEQIAQSTLLLDNFGIPENNTDLNATTGHHGLLPILGGGATNYLRADGSWAEPSGTGSGLPVVDTTSIVTGSVDATKQMRFEVDGLTTSTTRVLTVQNKDITICDNADLTAHISEETTWRNSVSQTEMGYLHGTSSDIQTQLDTKISIPSGSAQGDILYRDATGWTRLPAATSGYFLKTQGDAANPTWADMGTAAGIFEENTNVIREKSTTNYDNDFVIGSPQLADDGNSAHDFRMFFDKSKGAFRVGESSYTRWDDANVGEHSFASGHDTMASGKDSHAEGDTTQATAWQSHAEGFYTTASEGCAHAEGCSTTASGHDSHVEGCDSLAEQHCAHASGDSAKAYLVNMYARAGGRFGVVGDAQHSKHVVHNETTDATQTELYTYMTSTPYRIVLPASRTWTFTILIAARQTAGSAGTVGDSGGYEIKGVIKRDDVNNTTLVGSITNTTIAEDQAAWAVTTEADDTNEALVVKVTGEADKTIHWVATVYLTEVG